MALPTSPFLNRDHDLRAFAQRMRAHQIWWRRKHIKNQEHGFQNGKSHEWILPAANWEENLWPEIRTGTANPLPLYLKQNRVQRHHGSHNLNSSWVLCANLYFPFGNTAAGKTLLAGFLRHHVSPEVQTVDALELEFAEAGQLSPLKLLGEDGGSRGAGQTSPDLALLVNGRNGLILIENKLVEHSFYRCSARRLTGNTIRKANPDPSRCTNVALVMANPDTQCHQIEWNRKYWQHLKPVINLEAMSALRCCPAAYAGYQLFRQQALAEGIASSGKYDLVVSCVAWGARNRTLQHSLKSTGISDLKHEWQRLFTGKAQFAICTHQQWVNWVREHDSKQEWRGWLSYIEERYAYWASSPQPNGGV